MLDAALVATAENSSLDKYKIKVLCPASATSEHAGLISSRELSDFIAFELWDFIQYNF